MYYFLVKMVLIKANFSFTMNINCKGKLIDLSSPKIMGILNLTPDSFYDGGKYTNQSDILAQTAKMLAEGATFIDLGAYSSRPGAKDVSEEEELSRLLPIISLLLKNFPEIILSIDTFRSKVAEKAIGAGAAMINDISAGNLDDQMIPTVAKLQVPYVMMHMKGTPKTMQSQTHYDDILQEIIFYFSEKIAQARALGLNDLIIDPGFGFSKDLDQNYFLLKNMEVLENLNMPILAGVSRKSMIYKALDITSEDALNGTSIINTVALMNGANILRVHDVKEAKECTNLLTRLQ